jgi:ABC-type multidrug transport system fused ATPase/permease subunit
MATALDCRARRSVSPRGVVVNLGLGDIQPVGAGVASLTRGIGGLTAVLAVGLILFTYSWQLCVVVLVGVVLVLRVNDWLVKPYRASQRVVRDRMADLTGVALDASSGLRVIKGPGAADRFSARYRTASPGVLSAATAMARSAGVVAGYQAFAAGLLMAGTVWRTVVRAAPARPAPDAGCMGARPCLPTLSGRIR